MSKEEPITQLSENTTHVVVQFARLDSNGKRLVELVSRFWLRQKKNYDWICKFPPSKDYKNLDKWIENGKFPSRTWREYGVIILNEASM